MGLSYVLLLMGLFYVHSSILYGSFLCTKPPILLYMGPSYLLLCPFYVRWSLIFIVSYILLWVNLMYTDYCGVLLSYIRQFLIYSVSYVLLKAHLMYIDCCGVLLSCIRWSLIL